MENENLRVFGVHEQKVIDQAMRCLNAEEGSVGSLSADGHFGYSAPVGLSVAYREHVSPAAVGYDIGCGNMAVATSLMRRDLTSADLAGLMDRIYEEVPFGMGRSNHTGAIDHPVLDAIARANYTPQRELWGLARKQLGTVGAGNHYVDLFVDDLTGRVWVGVHFGSRGFGHKTATMFLDMAARENGNPGYQEGKGEMEAPPDLLHIASGAGGAYVEAMTLAGQYARAGREVVVDQVLGILGAERFGEPVHNHHNYAWAEVHDVGDGLEEFWVIRKGATPAFPGQEGFVGASMGEPAVILQGVEGSRSKEALYSTVHGAGRAMSRTAAAGKSRKRWACNNRACDWVQKPRTHVDQPGGTRPSDWVCPECKHTGMRKVWVREVEGAVDWDATLTDLRMKGIELRGANAEEAPGAYKRLSEVLGYHEGTVEILHTLRPLGVAMASGDTRDAYKD